MRVVHVSDSLLSGAPFRLAQIQKLHGIDARNITAETKTSYGPIQRSYPFDLLSTDAEEVLRAVLEAADIVHYHQRWQDCMLFQSHPWAWPLLKDRPSVFQFHTPRVDWMEPILRDPKLIKLVVAQYQVRLFPECIPVQNAVPIDDELHRPLNVRNRPPIIAFTPPDCRYGGWWNKGCDETIRILAGGYRHVVVTDRGWRETMEVRQRCDIAIDEVVTGSYHMCSLEALSQGLAVVAGLDEKTVDALEVVTGTRVHPWIVANLDTLDRSLTALISSADELSFNRQASRDYMERYWSPEVLVRKFRAIYDLVLERNS
jgi:hypothetical protein